MASVPARTADHVMLLRAFVFVHQVSKETTARMVAHLGTTHKTVTKNVQHIVQMGIVIEFLVFVNVPWDFLDHHVTILVQNGHMEQTVWNNVHVIMKTQKHVIIRLGNAYVNLGCMVRIATKNVKMVSMEDSVNSSVIVPIPSNVTT